MSSESRHKLDDIAEKGSACSNEGNGHQSIHEGTIWSKIYSHLICQIDPSEEIPPPPDGGLQAWNQVAMAWLVLLLTWGWVNSFGIFQSYYEVHMDVSPSTISWIGSVQNWLTFFIGAFSGRLLDAGLYRPALLVGAVIQVLGIFFMSLSTSYWQLMLTQGIMTGLGGGIFFTPSMGILGTYFTSNRALAMGIATSGNSAGGMIYPVLVGHLLPKLGFGWTVRILGFLNLGCLCLVVAFMRPRLPARKSGPFIDFSAFRTPTYAVFVTGIFFIVWPVYYTFYYLAPFGQQVLNLPFSATTTLVIIINGAGLPARIIPPFLADRYGVLNLLAPTLVILTIISYTWLAVSTTAGLWAYTPIYGIASAAFQCIIPSTVASICPEMSRFGTWLGMCFATMSFAALTGPPIGGALQSATGGGFTAPILWAAASATVGTTFVVIARILKGGLKLREKC